MEELGLINEFHPSRSKGTVIQGANGSSDRVAGMNIVASSVEEFNKKEARILDEVRILDSAGNDIMRKDFLSPLGPLL